jgi:hypothetical protein
MLSGCEKPGLNKVFTDNMVYLCSKWKSTVVPSPCAAVCRTMINAARGCLLLICCHGRTLLWGCGLVRPAFQDEDYDCGLDRRFR